LLLRSGRWVNVQVVTNKAEINSRGVVGVLCKHIHISSEKSDQFLFFLRRQLGADLEKFLWIAVDSEFI